MKRTLQFFGLLAGLILITSQSIYAAVIDITDDGSGTGTTTWTANNIYVLHGMVFVNEGQTLTIEPGTVIKGAPGTGANASALIVARGAKIMAEGTAIDPIIFTFEGDPLDGSVPYDTRGQWGGVIVLGNGVLNSVPGESAIEGIPTSEPRGLYGGSNDNDDSGVIKYVSIRHGGTDIGAGNEINGLTLGGVGSTTEIDYVEIFANNDDGIEFFGGKPNVKHALVVFCADDSYDYDEGFRGNGQFWVTVQDAVGGVGDRGGEHDGGTDPEDGNPYATPTISNVTYIGRGIESGRRALTFRDNAGGFYSNSVFANWAKGTDIEKLGSGEDSYNRFDVGDLSLNNNVYWDVVTAGGNASAEDLYKVSFADGVSDNGESTDFSASYSANDNQTGDLGLVYDNVAPGSFALQLVPIMGPAYGAVVPADNWFDDVSYKGAFQPNTEAWITGWTLLDQMGFLADVVLRVNEIAELESSVFPNPAEDVLNIELAEQTNLLIVDIHDLSGRLINNIEFKNVTNRISLNVSDLTSGLYLISLKSNKVKRSFKVFIR